MVALALSIVLSGCPKAPKVITKRIPGASGESKLQVRVHISSHANNGNPVALDLVLVSDKKLLQELQKMTASEWFEKREQIMLDFPKEGDVEVSKWEWVPGQVVQVDKLRVRPEIKGGVIFANYFKPGAHRAVINPRKDILIKLQDDKIEVETEK
jgi:hypothetical protein